MMRIRFDDDAAIADLALAVVTHTAIAFEVQVGEDIDDAYECVAMHRPFERSEGEQNWRKGCDDGDPPDLIFGVLEGIVQENPFYGTFLAQEGDDRTHNSFICAFARALDREVHRLMSSGFPPPSEEDDGMKLHL